METGNSNTVNIDNGSDSDDSIEEIGVNILESQASDIKGKIVGPKKRKLTSKVWKHFTFLEKKGEEPLEVKCNRCGQKYSGESSYGTGNLKRHLKKCLTTTTRHIG